MSDETIQIVRQYFNGHNHSKNLPFHVLNLLCHQALQKADQLLQCNYQAWEIKQFDRNHPDWFSFVQGSFWQRMKYQLLKKNARTCGVSHHVTPCHTTLYKFHEETAVTFCFVNLNPSLSSFHFDQSFIEASAFFIFVSCCFVLPPHCCAQLPDWPLCTLQIVQQAFSMEFNRLLLYFYCFSPSHSFLPSENVLSLDEMQAKWVNDWVYSYLFHLDVLFMFLPLYLVCFMMLPCHYVNPMPWDSKSRPLSLSSTHCWFFTWRKQVDALLISICGHIGWKMHV